MTLQYKAKVTNAVFVVLLRKEIEMKQCSAYVAVRQRHELPVLPRNMDTSADYETVGESDGVYEKIPGES